MLNAFFFILTGVLWGGSFVAIQFVLRAYPPLLGVSVRLGIASATLALLWRSGSVFRVSRADLVRIAVAGFFSVGLPFYLLFWGEQSISAGLGGILNGTTPVWAFLIAALFFQGKREIRFHKIFGLAIGLLGILFVFGPRVSLEGTSAEWWGSLAVLAMAISYGLGGNLSKRLFSGAKPVDFRSNLFYQHFSSFLLLLGLSAVWEHWPSMAKLASNGPALAGLLYLGMASSALAFFLYYRLLKEWGVVKASSVAYIIPVAAILWDFFIFGNIPRSTDLMGAMIILCGVGLIQSSQ